MKTKRLFSLMMVLALVLGLGSVVFAAKLTAPTAVTIAKAENDIGENFIKAGEWYVSFTDSNTANAVASRTVTLTASGASDPVANAMTGVVTLDDSTYYQKINVANLTAGTSYVAKVVINPSNTTDDQASDAGESAATAYTAPAEPLKAPGAVTIKKADKAIGTLIKAGDWCVSFTDGNADGVVDSRAITLTEKGQATAIAAAMKGNIEAVENVYYQLIDVAKLTEGKEYIAKVTLTPTSTTTHTASEAVSAATLYAADGEETGGKELDAIITPRLDIDELVFTYDKDANSGDLYYRFSPDATTPKEAKWTKATVPTLGSFDISKLVKKTGLLEFATSTTAPGNKDTAKTFYSIVKPDDKPTKPTLVKYAPAEAGKTKAAFYVVIKDITASVKYKPETYSEYITPSTTEDDLGGYIGSDGNFYFPVGKTVAQLLVVNPSSTDNGYKAASAPQKFKVAAEVKIPSVKVNYAKNIVQLKEGKFEVSLDGNDWKPVAAETEHLYAKVDADAKGVLINDAMISKYYVRTSIPENGKKPGSAPVEVHLFEQAVFTLKFKSASSVAANDLPDLRDYMALVGKKMMPTSGGYPLEHKDAKGKWKKGLPKFEAEKGIGVTEIRIASVGNLAVSDSFWMEADASGKLSVALTKEGTFIPCVNATP